MLAVFRAAHANDRYSLVHEYPEFFQGGNHDNCPNTPEYLASAELTLISQTSTTERAGLFGLSQAVKPLRSLEIGRARGGSTWILASGCLATEGARFVSIDPNERGGEHFLNEKLRQKLVNQGVVLHDVASPNGIADAL
ncbi:MAG UNVERIFIED_CONTAM: class I SAM-dependent methyltransferase [Planctomycetaceae bacterium]